MRCTIVDDSYSVLNLSCKYVQFSFNELNISNILSNFLLIRLLFEIQNYDFKNSDRQGYLWLIVSEVIHWTSAPRQNFVGQKIIMLLGRLKSIEAHFPWVQVYYCKLPPSEDDPGQFTILFRVPGTFYNNKRSIVNGPTLL